MSESTSYPEMKPIGDILFDQQVSRYVELGYYALLEQTPDEFESSFAELKERILNTTQQADSSTFIIALPEDYITLNKQLSLSGSRAFLEPREMQDVESWDEEPHLPYALLGVNEGAEFVDMAPADAINVITESGYHGFRLIELINLSVHAPQLWVKYRGLYAVGTEHIDSMQSRTLVDLYR